MQTLVILFTNNNLLIHVSSCTKELQKKNRCWKFRQKSGASNFFRMKKYRKSKQISHTGAYQKVQKKKKVMRRNCKEEGEKWEMKGSKMEEDNTEPRLLLRYCPVPDDGYVHVKPWRVARHVRRGLASGRGCNIALLSHLLPVVASYETETGLSSPSELPGTEGGGGKMSVDPH